MAAELRSGIGRPVDLAYPSNRFVAVLTPLAGLAAGALSLFVAGDGFWEAVRTGVLSGGAAFLAWAIGREVEPDRPMAANAAAVGAPAVLLVGDPALGQLFAVLLAARIVVRSTGLAPTPVDLVVAVGLAIYVGTTDGGLPVALILAVALAADVGLPGRAPQRSAVAALVAAAGSVIAALIADGIRIDPLRPVGEEWILVGVAAVGLLVLARPAVVLSTTDLSDELISPGRLRAARAITIVAGAAGFAWAGAPALAALGAAWAALAATFVVSLIPR